MKYDFRNKDPSQISSSDLICPVLKDLHALDLAHSETCPLCSTFLVNVVYNIYNLKKFWVH